jgi:hypothetical protein
MTYTGLGHHVSIMASCPGQPDLWYKADGTWTGTKGDRHIFGQVQEAQHTPMPDLPDGYRTGLVFETIP